MSKDKVLLTYDEQVYLLYARIRTNTVDIEESIRNNEKEKIENMIKDYLMIEYGIEDQEVVKEIKDLFFE